MALLGQEYESSDEGSSPPHTNGSIATTATQIVTTPDVSLDVWSYYSLG